MVRISAILLIISFYSHASLKVNSLRTDLLKGFATEYSSDGGVQALKKKVFSGAGQSVPALLHVMKRSDFPIKNRWMATFWLGQIAGKRSANILSKFQDHPDWQMRLAAFKTLQALRSIDKKRSLSKALSDSSLIVRIAGVDAVSYLGIKELAPKLFQMLADKKNYVKSKKNYKRTAIIGKLVSSLAKLKYEKAKKSFLRMIVKKKYDDIFPQLNLALKELTGNRPLGKTRSEVRAFWNRKLIKS